MNNIQTDDADGTFVSYHDLNMERKKVSNYSKVRSYNVR